MRVLTLLAIALALGGATAAEAAPTVELSPAWGGWSRPGRTTEITVRVHADRATRGSVEIDSGDQSLRAGLDLGGGDTRRIDMPLPANSTLAVRIALAGTPVEQRDVGLSLSEAPLLGVALADASRAALPGFHSVAVAAAALPRHAAAYSSVDALLIDHATLSLLDPAQVAALLGHVAGCGRLALVGVPPEVEALLRGAAGCGARMLVKDHSVVAALDGLAATLAVPAGTPPSVADLADLAPAAPGEWRRLALALGACAALLILALLLARSTRVLVMMPLVATLAVLGLLAVSTPPSRLVVWAEAESGARVAQYQAWQAQAGRRRGTLAMPVLNGLGQPRACQSRQALRVDLEGPRAVPVRAHLDGRLFESAALCYSGTFPVLRTVQVTALAGDRLAVRNAGSSAWPPGVLLSASRVLALPALEAGAAATLSLAAARPPADAAESLALARTPVGGHAGFWPLALDTLAEAPAGAKAWLLVPITGTP